MANKDWWEDMNPGDCLKDGTWGDMVDYIQHSACTDFTIYSQCTDTSPVFKFGGDNDIEFDGDRAIMIDNDETYIGHGAGDSITSGTNNTLIGEKAGTSITEGLRNTILGSEAGYTLIDGDDNVIIGRYAAHQLIDGNSNVIIGKEAGGTSMDNEDACVIIGYQAGRYNTASNRLYINNSSSAFPLIYGEFDNDVIKFGDNNSAWNIQFMQSRIHMLETTTPGAIANYGAIYCKADNKLYFQDGAGVEHEIALVP